MSHSSRSDSSNDSGSIKSSSLSIGSSAMINSVGQVVYDIPENELHQRVKNRISLNIYRFSFIIIQ